MQWMDKYMEVCKSSSTTEERTKVLKARVLELEVELSAKAQECVKLDNQVGEGHLHACLAHANVREAREADGCRRSRWPSCLKGSAVRSPLHDGIHSAGLALALQAAMRLLDLEKVREQADADAMARIAHMAAEKRRAEAAYRDMQEKLEVAEREHASQVKALKDEKHRELDTINSRVRTAISKKDEALAAVTSELNSARARCKQYEELLEKQRQEFLGASWGNNAA